MIIVRSRSRALLTDRGTEDSALLGYNIIHTRRWQHHANMPESWGSCTVHHTVMALYVWQMASVWLESASSKANYRLIRPRLLWKCR